MKTATRYGMTLTQEELIEDITNMSKIFKLISIKVESVTDPKFAPFKFEYEIAHEEKQCYRVDNFMPSEFGGNVIYKYFTATSIEEAKEFVKANKNNCLTGTLLEETLVEVSEREYISMLD